MTHLPACSRCDARMSPDPDGPGLWCQFCGSTRSDAEAQHLAEQYQSETARQPSRYEPPKRDWDMSFEERRALDSAWESIQAGDLKSARMVLRTALFGKRHTFADGWYLLSLATEDRDEKLNLLEQVLAIQPYHEYAWRDKGVLEGVIPDAAPLEAPDIEAGDAVETVSHTQACPLCGGLLAFEVALGGVICESCRYQPGAGPALAGARGFDKLENALLQRRFGFSKEWHIGARLLVCQNCHAQLTLIHTALATQCPFCDSAHVLIEDAVGSFEEPDAILPFRVDRRVAARALHKRIPAGMRTNIARGDMWGVYLPFWSFKSLVSITVPLGLYVPAAVRLGAFSIEEALVGGIKQPKQAVLYELMPYHLDDLIPYDPRFLGGRWMAQIYNVDVIQASITARAYAMHIARRIASDPTYSPPTMDLARTDSHAYNPPDTPFWRIADVEIEALNYRLLLLPVWMITLSMSNGSHVPAIVNGQTAEAILSESFVSPETLVAGPGRAPVAPLPIIPPGPTRSVRHTVIRPIAPPKRD